MVLRGGGGGLIPAATRRSNPAAFPAVDPSHRTSFLSPLLSSRSTSGRLPASSSVCPARWIRPPLRFHLSCRVSPLILDPRRLTVYPPLLLKCTGLLQVCLSRAIACVHCMRVSLVAGQVLTAAARSSAPRPIPTLRTLPRHPPQHAAHRRPCLCPPHCPCCCCQLCGTCGVSPLLPPPCPARPVLLVLLRLSFTDPACPPV